MLRCSADLKRRRITNRQISGEISVFYFEDSQVKYGLPIMPNSLQKPLKYLDEEAHYSCTFCGHTEIKSPGNAGSCRICKKDEWVLASNKKRIT